MSLKSGGTNIFVIEKCTAPKLSLQVKSNFLDTQYLIYFTLLHCRTHVFDIKKRPDDIPKDAKIYNLNVRGKRGNAQQVYPAVEYDFVPNRLEIEKNDYIHIQ